MKALPRLLFAILCLLAVSPAAFAGSTTGKMVPLVGDYVVTKLNESGSPVTTTSRFYRDSEGRTRLDEGKLVTISDPVAAATIYLFPEERTYLRQSWDPAPGEQERTSSEGTLETTESSRGYKSIEGWLTEGRQYEIVIPAGSKLGNKLPVAKQATIWFSRDLQIPVSIEIADPNNGPSSHRYANIVADTEPHRALFQVPDGYEVQPTPTEPVQVRRCNLRINPDPLILVSFRPFVRGSGMQVATTNVNRGCIIADRAAIWQPPLNLTLLTPLYLPSFAVRWSDGGGYVPYDYWVVFGEIAFLATNGQDITIKDGLVVLTVIYVL